MKLIAVAALIASLFLGHAARADVIYTLTLTPTQGSLYGGTGSVTLASAPSANGISNYSGSSLIALSFLIDGQTFGLAGYPGASIQFLDGGLRNISFAELIGGSPHRYNLQTSGVYAFYYNDLLVGSYGTFAASPVPSLIPEPSSLALLAVALTSGVCLLAVRRRRTAGRSDG